MEQLAHNIAEKIGLQMNYDQDKQDVIAYGLTALFQMLIIFSIITVIGCIFGFWYESMIIFLGVGLIRKATGGAHSRTMMGCILISVLSITLLSSLSRYLLSYHIDIVWNYGICLFVFLLCFFVFYLKVPVDSPNKPIVKPEKIKRLRKQSFLILTVFFILSILMVTFSIWNNRFYSIAMSFRLTLLWQMFTLTKIGAKFFNKIDLNFHE